MQSHLLVPPLSNSTAHRVSFRKKKSSKNVESTPKEGAAATPTEKAADDAREPEVSSFALYICVVVANCK